MTIRMTDLETTGTKPPEARICEVATVDLVTDTGQLLAARSTLINPGIPIPPEAQGIHHISDTDVAGAPAWEAVRGSFLTHFPRPRAYAAHFREFEMQWLETLTGSIPWICTYKCALRIWPDAPDHKNQTLRYMLAFDVDPKLVTPPHRALPDAIVSAHILREELKAASFDQLVQWSGEPAVLPRCPIGEHRGKQWRDVPPDFLSWMIRTPDMKPDLKWNAQHALNERASNNVNERRDAYMDMAKAAALVATSPDDLRTWFAAEADHRDEHGITKGTTQYGDLIRVCGDHVAALLKQKAPENAPALSDPG